MVYRTDYRTIRDTEERPQFEKMISDIERARQHWDKPGLRDYGRVLMKIVGHTALDQAGDVVRPFSEGNENVTPSVLPAAAEPAHE